MAWPQPWWDYSQYFPVLSRVAKLYCLFLIHWIRRKSVPTTLRYSKLAKFKVISHSCHSEEGYSETSTTNKVIICIDEKFCNVFVQKCMMMIYIRLIYDNDILYVIDVWWWYIISHVAGGHVPKKQGPEDRSASCSPAAARTCDATDAAGNVPPPGVIITINIYDIQIYLHYVSLSLSICTSSRCHYHHHYIPTLGVTITITTTSSRYLDQ